MNVKVTRQCDRYGHTRLSRLNLILAIFFQDPGTVRVEALPMIVIEQWLRGYRLGG